MSKQYAESLLLQYNKDLYKNKPAQDAASTRFGTWSYANTYDALYDRYSQNRNFNINMWRDAIKLGEQDNYLALLEQNKDNTLSGQFYDDEYYDYEAMMMEMYLPLADNAKLEKYSREVFNDVTGKWETQDLGEMTQRQYFEYLLAETRAVKAAEIQRQIEQDQKDTRSFMATLGSDTLATLGEFGEGLLTAITGVIDIFGGLGYASYQAIAEHDNWADAFVEYFGEVGLTQSEKETVRAALDEYERTNTHFRDIDGNLTGVGKYFSGIANSIGMMVPSILLAIPTAGTSLAWMPQVTFYASVFGSGMYETAVNTEMNGPSWRKILNTALKTGAEAVIEWTLGKVLGSTIQNRMLNIGRRNLNQNFIKGFTKTSGLKYLGKSAAQEGLEEFLQDFGTSLIDAFSGLYAEGYEIDFQALVDSFCIGALSSIVMSTGRVGVGAMVSRARNRKLAGSGDIVIEIDGETQKVTGFNRLYYGEILSDFQEALKELKNSKFGTKKNLALAQEVYGAISAISQFYSSFDKTRLENCERLLSRVIKTEKNADAEKVTLDFAEAVEKSFTDMTSEARIHHVKSSVVEKAKKAAKKADKKLKDGNVKDIKSAIDDELLKRQTEREQLEKVLGKMAVSRLDELMKSKEYEGIFTTDGNIAVEEDGFLFVSEAWLKNFTVREIREFLTQSQLIDMILEDKDSQPLIDELEKFYRDFTKDESATRETILENFLFNSSIYQAFILSNGGKNIHTYAKAIFFFYNFIAGEGKTWAEQDNANKARNTGLYTAIINKIKKAWREPTLKAILNWGIKPQDIGADAVLNRTDKELVNLYENRKRVLLDKGMSRSAYQHRVDDIIRDNRNTFTDKEMALIERVRNDDNVTEDERLQVQIMLDIADRSTSDIYLSEGHTIFNSIFKSVMNRSLELRVTSSSDVNAYRTLVYDAAKHLRTFVSIHLSPDTVRKKEELETELFTLAKKSGTIDDYKKAINDFGTIAQTILEDLIIKREGITDYALTLPYQTASLLDEGDTAGAQLVADVLNEFQKKYGISAKQMMSGDLTGMSIQQRNQLTQDMDVFGTDDFVRFAQRYLENMLGNNYIVTPTSVQRHLSSTADNTKLLEDIKTEQKEVLSLVDKIYLALRRSNKKESNELSNWLLKFYDTARNLLSPSSELKMFLRKEDFGLIDILAKAITQVSSSRESLSVISKNRKVIKNFYNKALSSIDFRVTETGISDFVIAKKISAKELLPREIFEMSPSDRADLFYKMTDDQSLDGILNDKIIKIYANIRREIDQGNDEKSLALTYMEHCFAELTNLVYAGEALTLESLGAIELTPYPEDPDFTGKADDILTTIHRHINPLTGISYDENSITDESDKEIFKRVYGPILETPLKIEDVIDISLFPDALQNFIRKTELKVEYLSVSASGFYESSTNTLVVRKELEDPFSTFIHEFNHLLQDYYNMPGGFNPDTAEEMLDFLVYVCNNYRVAVNWYLRHEGLVGISGEITEKDITQKDYMTRASISFLAYLMVQGEVWSRTFNHNGKPIHGFLEIFSDEGGYILAPDNKTKFMIKSTDESTSKSYSPKMTPALAQSAAEVSLLNVLKNRGNVETRDTVHTAYTGGSTRAITSQLAGPTVSLIERWRLTLDDFIDNPSLLIPEIQQKLNGDYSRGNVFNRIKEWVEEHVEGTSIDRRRADNATVFVDDKVYDKLLTRDMLEYRENDDLESSVLSLNYGEREVPLKTFYKKSELRNLGLNEDLPVIVTPTRGSEYVRNITIDGKHYEEAIILNATKKTDDAEFINRLNHEFRHCMQYHSGLHMGFTPKIKVTQEMTNDVKKHLPGVYKDKELREWAQKAKRSDESVDDWITRHTIYYHTGGELAAYGFAASELAIEPAYVITEAGKPTIIMPWHFDNMKTGRYETEFIGNDLDDSIGMPEKKSTGSILPRVEKKRKYTDKATFVGEDGEIEKVIYEYDKKVRRFNKKRAEGTNLMYYWKRGEAYRQMDPEMQEFIIATTGHEDELPTEIVKAIENAELTKQVLFAWIRNTDNMNQFTFDLIKEHFFPNTAFKSFEELNNFFVLDISVWWAAANVLKTRVDYEYILRENSVTSLVDFLEKIKDTDLGKQIYKHSLNYYKQEAASEELARYQRLFALQYFDGSLNGAFYVANSFLTTIKAYREELAGITKSTDATVRPNDTKDNAASTFGDTISDKAKTAGSTGNLQNVGNDLTAIYDVSDIVDKSIDEMVAELIAIYSKKRAEEEGFDTSDMSALRENTDFLPILRESLTYARELSTMELDDVTRIYLDTINASLVGQEVKDDVLEPSTQKDKSKKLREQSRINIRDRIKRRAKRLLKYIADGKIMFSQLPEEVQAMFTYEEGKTKSGKIVKNYVLRSEVYSVGRGRAKASESTLKQTGRFTYQPETNITDDHEIFRHDVTQILENERILTDAVEAVKKVLSVSKQQKIKTDEGIRQVNKSIKETAKVLEKALTRKTPTKDDSTRVREFRPRRSYTQTDTPNIFTISASVDMPDVLNKILDTSFDEFADTEVQWVSVDDQGQLYNKKKEGKFNSQVKHEVANWDAFYEANRETLQTLTRKDVLEIITYFANAKVNNGPAGKFAAFEIFLLGFFVDAARNNYGNWNFSDTEISNLEKLYEARASAAGSALNAVGQMLKVVNPIKVIKSRMLDDWTAINDDDKEALLSAIDSIRKNSTDKEAIKQYAARIDDLFKEFSERQLKHDKMMAKHDGKLLSRIWNGIKTFRYTAMLSGPATWVRNQLGNTVQITMNTFGDIVGNLVFPRSKKAYRENQWDIYGTKTSEQAKEFIDTFIKKSPLFDPLYNLSGKYDIRRKKEIEGELGLFASVITKAYEKEYSAKSNWVITKAVNAMMTDKHFIKFATNRYFGKMLTIQIENGKIDPAEGLSAKALDLFAEAVILANADYMHKRSALADILDVARDKHPVFYKAFSFWQPFANSSINWYIEEGIKLTPIGLIQSLVRMARFEKQVDKLQTRRARGETVVDSRLAEYLLRRDIGKGIVSTLFLVFGAILATLGHIRLDEEDDKFYVYSGDGSIKVDISDIHGTSSVFVGASIAQIWLGKDESALGRIEKALSHTTETMMDGFLVTEFFKRHTWDDGVYEALLTETNSVLSSFVPQLIQTIVVLTNEEKIRYSSGMKGMWERWLNSFIPTQPLGNRVINPYTGEPEDKWSSFIGKRALSKGLLGPKIYWVEMSETERMCRELDVNKGELTGEITVGEQKKKLDRLALNKKYGELNKESLAKIKSQKHKVEMPNGKFQTLSWDKMSDKQRASVLNRTMTRNADIAKVYVWTQTMGNKYYASGSLWEELRKLGITKNVYKGDKGFVE